MKYLLSFFVAGLFLLPFQAHSQQTEVDLFKEVFDQEKRSLFESFISIDSETGENFWPIYDAYEAERTVIADQRFKLLQRYNKVYEGMTDDQLQEMVKEMFGIKKKTVALEKKYYNKIRKATTPELAATFLQFEDYILTLLRAEMFYQMDFVK